MSENDEIKAVRNVVRSISECWRSGRYDEIGQYLSDEAVIAPLGSDKRVRGREPYVRSFREYDAAATTHEFRAEDPQVDIVGDVAVAVTPFFVEYELQGTRFRERGHDLLVLRRTGREWRVLWRTMQAEPAPG